MANKCDICGRGPQFGKNVSHSHHKTLREFNLNIQRIKVRQNGEVKTLNVCTRCIKSSKVVKA